MRQIAVVLILCIVTTAGLALGMLIAHLEPWPYSRVVRWLNPPSAAVFVDDNPYITSTKFFDLRIERFPRETRDEPGLGGGLSPYGEDAVLLEGDGTLSLVRIDELETHPLDIAAPPSGREAVMAPLQSGEIQDYQRNFWHRYLDLVVGVDALYLSYQNYDVASKCFSVRVGRVDLNGRLEDSHIAPEDWRVLFETKPCLPFKSTGRHSYAGHEAGGQIVLAHDGYLLLTVGHFEFDGYGGPDFAQDLTKDYGKTFRIDPATGEAELFTVGHRNPQGLVQTPDGRFWASEQGPEGGDELNVLVEGENFGWPLATYGTDYGDRVWPVAERQGHHDRWRKPAWAWVPSIAPSNIAYVSEFSDVWDGNLLVAALKDTALWRVVVDRARVVTMERIAFGERIRSVLVQGGYVLVYTDPGNVLRISPIEVRRSANLEQLTASLSKPAKRELDRCLVCHTRGRAEGAPNLCGVVGRAIGQSDFDNYSAAFTALDGVWDAALLNRFLADVNSVVPGTVMPNPAIDGLSLRREIGANLDFFCN